MDADTVVAAGAIVTAAGVLALAPVLVGTGVLVVLIGCVMGWREARRAGSSDRGRR